MKINLSVFFQAPVNILIFRHVSLRISFLYMQLLGFLYYQLLPREKRHIKRNIRDLLASRDEKHIRRITRKAFKGIFAHYFEKMCAGFLPSEKIQRYVRSHVTIEGKEFLDQALAKGKGCIFVTAHWGAVELIPWVLNVSGYPASIILECKTAKLARSLKEHEARMHTELIISSTAGGSVLARGLQALKSNRVLMTACDEVDTWHKRKNVTIELFGQRLFFDNTIEVISRRTGAAVVGAFLERTRSGRYVLHVEDISVQREVPNTARACFELWHKYVSLYPEQWYQWKKWDRMKSA